MVGVGVCESSIEDVTLRWFGQPGYSTARGEDVAREGVPAERESFGDVLLVQRSRDAIDRLNPAIPQEVRDGAFRKVVRPDRPTLIANNRAFHAMLREGVEVGCMGDGGRSRGDRVALLPKRLSGESRVSKAEEIIGENN
jgi:type I restriction enzyme R subunit